MSLLHRIRSSLRLKVLVAVTAVVLGAGLLSTTIGIRVITANVVGQAYDMVRASLHFARFAYDEQIGVIRLYCAHLATLPYVHQAVISSDRPLLTRKLREVQQEAGLDFLAVTDAQGRIVARACPDAASGDSVVDLEIVNRSLATGSEIMGSTIVTPAQLAREGCSLASRATIAVVPTPHARRQATQPEQRGLVMMAACPLVSAGRVVGVMYGGRLINNQHGLVDRISAMAFGQQKFAGHDYGTTTIFLDGLRIATNVTTAGGDRAVGTMVSDEVYRHVIERQMTWLDRAFVVNAWYLAAYEPLRDINDRVIGILYVGIIEKKFDQIRQRALSVIVLATLICLVAALGGTAWLLHRILRPVVRLTDAARELAAGNETAQIPVRTRDEVGSLCQSFNTMVEAVAERDRRILEESRKQTVQLSKLASLGRLASGIAHEINNPLTGVLTHSCMLREELRDSQHQEDLKIIIDETLRCRKIVSSVLEFARETKLETEYADINEIIESTLTIVENHPDFHDITITRELGDGLPLLQLDINLIRSVVTNILLNAMDAMPDGGTLTITTRLLVEQQAVAASVTDTGVGIPADVLPRIFEPFFTTKEPGKGTGLGLSICYGIVERHNGALTVTTSESGGATFTVTLPTP